MTPTKKPRHQREPAEVVPSSDEAPVTFPASHDETWHDTDFVTAVRAARELGVGERWVRKFASAKDSNVRRTSTGWSSLMLFAMEDLRAWKRLKKADLMALVRKRLKHAKVRDIEGAMRAESVSGKVFSQADVDRLVARLRKDRPDLRPMSEAPMVSLHDLIAGPEPAFVRPALPSPTSTSRTRVKQSAR